MGATRSTIHVFRGCRHCKGVKLFSISFSVTMDNSDLNAQDANGQTLLMQAAKMKNINLLKQLLSKGVQLNTTDHDGNHALLLAQLSSDNDACVSTLIKAGSSINVMNKDRQTPFAIAMVQNN